MESILPVYVAWRAGTTNRVVVPARQAGNRFLGSLKGLQIQAQGSSMGFGLSGGKGLAMSNQRSFKIGSFRFAAFVPKKIECKRF